MNTKVEFKENDFSFEKNSNSSNNSIVCSVNDEDQLKVCLDKKVDRVYVKDIDLYIEKIDEMIERKRQLFSE